MRQIDGAHVGQMMMPLRNSLFEIIEAREADPAAHDVFAIGARAKITKPVDMVRGPALFGPRRQFRLQGMVWSAGR